MATHKTSNPKMALPPLFRHSSCRGRGEKEPRTFWERPESSLLLIVPSLESPRHDPRKAGLGFYWGWVSFDPRHANSNNARVLALYFSPHRLRRLSGQGFSCYRRQRSVCKMERPVGCKIDHQCHLSIAPT